MSVNLVSIKNIEPGGNCSNIENFESLSYRPCNAQAMSRKKSETASQFVSHQTTCTKCTNTEWYDFTQSTSLHGLRYIWDQNTFTLRRIVWLLLVLGGIGLMSYQIIDRVVYYFDSPVTVNLMVNFNKSLQFPAITFCNQNAFRSTVTAASGRYDLITSIYNNFNNFSLEDLEKYNNQNISLGDLYLTSGHRIEDMVVRCKWRGMDCGPENFTRTISDKGVCFAFNTDKNNRLQVDSVGSENGLSITLNIEDYEYMPGPNDASGIKLLVHDVQQFPKVHELGIALSAGLESFVGLEFISVQNLPKPHGRCANMKLKYFEVYSPDNCQIECLTELTIDYCGCRLQFMPFNTDSPPVCSLYEYYNCYLPRKDELLYKTHDQCSCPVACSFKIFDPTLSYSSLSQMVQSRLLHGIDVDSLTQKYTAAREITHRLQRDYSEAFKSRLRSVKDRFLKVKSVLLEDLTRYLIYQRNAVIETYRDIHRAENDTRHLHKFRRYIVAKNFVRAGTAMGERTFDSITQDMQQFVIKTEELMRTIASSNTSSREVRQSIYLILSNELKTKIIMCDKALQNYTQLYSAYSNGTQVFRYFYSGHSLRDREHIVPLSLMRNALNFTRSIRIRTKRFKKDLERIKSNLEEIKNISFNSFYTHSFNKTAYHLASVQYLHNCRNFLQSKSMFIKDATNWPLHQMNKQDDELKIISKDIKKYKNNILSSVRNLDKSLLNVEQLFLDKINTGIQMCETYLLNGSVSKLNIAEFFISDEIKNGYNSLSVLFDEVRIRGQNIFDDWTNFLLHSKKLWKLILDDSDMKRYYRYKNLEEYLVDYATVSQNLTEIFNSYRDEYDLRRIVQNTDDIFLRELKRLIFYMEDFNGSREVNHDFVRRNFLVVNLYYKELNYEQITQQRAYDIIALLCDIGGSMGLFIGASVMTMFEVIDLLSNSLATRILAVDKTPAKSNL